MKKKAGCNTDPKQDSFNLPQCVIDSFARFFFVLIKVLVSKKRRWRPTGEIQRHMFQREKVIDNTSSVTGGRVG